MQWETDHPNAYALTLKRAGEAVQQKKWDDVIGLAEKLKLAWPEDNRDEGCYALLATAYRETGKSDEERASLVSLTEHASAPFDALARLVAIDTERKDWGRLLDGRNYSMPFNPCDTMSRRHVPCRMNKSMRMSSRFKRGRHVPSSIRRIQP